MEKKKSHLCEIIEEKKREPKKGVWVSLLGTPKKIKKKKKKRVPLKAR